MVYTALKRITQLTPQNKKKAVRGKRKRKKQFSMSHNHLIRNGGGGGGEQEARVFVGKGKQEQLEEDEEGEEVRRGEEEEEEEETITQTPLLRYDKKEQESIQRARQLSAKQAQNMNTQSRQTHAVPLESNLTNGQQQKNRSKRGSSSKSDSDRYATQHASRSRFPRRFGERLSDWINNHNAAYCYAQGQMALSEKINTEVLLSESFVSSSTTTNIHSPVKQLRAFRRTLVYSELTILEQRIIAESTYCQDQLCAEPVRLSHAITGSEPPPPPESDCADLDVHGYFSIFHETYTVLCLCAPWELDGISGAAREDFVKRLDGLYEEITELKLKFVRSCDPKSGTTPRCNHRITIQELSDRFLEFADLIRELNDLVVKATAPKKSLLSGWGRKA